MVRPGIPDKFHERDKILYKIGDPMDSIRGQEPTKIIHGESGIWNPFSISAVDLDQNESKTLDKILDKPLLASWKKKM